MKNHKKYYTAFAKIIPLFLLFPMITNAQDPYAKIKTIDEKLTVFPFSEISPKGWIKEQIQENLDGFTGHLDSLAPDLIVKDDIYGRDRLTKHSKTKELGALGEGGDWQIQLYWWNSETQSNWWDGYIRSAILANDAQHLERIRKYINRILSTQDTDGYLGIYDPELRYKSDNENGELWAKATLLRGMIAWYEYSKEDQVLTAVKKAVGNTMANYPMETAHPFYSKNPNVGGLSHGLTFTDVLEQLFYITEDPIYLDYALFLYKDFSRQILNEDGQYVKLINEKIKLNGHGVHTYEQLRSLAAAYYASGNPELGKAMAGFLKKIDQTTTPSGGPIGDEWIGGKNADATQTGYEYCSLQELLHSYASLLAKTSSPDYADKIETLFFNAAQGARNPEHSCIAYLKSDNSYAMTGGRNGDESDAKQTRYRYSPVHREAAVCCVPNAGRIAPYYVQYMWLKDGNDMVASLLGPSELNTVLNGKKVKITEHTTYPYGNKIVFEVQADGADFTLKIRIPDWAEGFTVNSHYGKEDGFISIKRKWKKKETITLILNPEVKTHTDQNGETYFTYGGLVLAHPIKAVSETVKQYNQQGLADLEYSPIDLVLYEATSETSVTRVDNMNFEATLRNTKTNQIEKVPLKPIGKTILRQTTFKKP
jgi:uncharacterized protein